MANLTLTQSESLALARCIAALKRIARKPLPSNHKLIREWQMPVGIIAAPEKPAGAIGEHNPCDCPNCIANEALTDLKEFAQ